MDRSIISLLAFLLLTAQTFLPSGYTPEGMSFDFEHGRYWQGGATIGTDVTQYAVVSRASPAYQDDTTGNWTLFNSGVIRRTDKGSLVEESRTNSIRNNSTQGAIQGAPGTLPTNVTVLAANGLTTAVNALTVINGIDTIDLHISGTTSGTFYVLCFDGTSTIAASPGQIWTESFFDALVAGTLTNVTNINFDLRWAGASTVSDTAFVPTSTFKRDSATSTAPALTTFVGPCLSMNFSSAVAIDLTLRLGWPQLELGSYASSPIRTTNAAVVRQQDNLTALNTLIFSNAYSIFFKGTPLAPFNYSLNQGMLSIDDTTNNNRLQIVRNLTNGLVSYVTASSNVIGDNFNSVAVPATGVSSKVAVGATPGSTGMSLNGAAVVGGTSSAVAAGSTITRIDIGNQAAQNRPFNGYVERVEIMPSTLLTDAQKQQWATP